MFLGLKPSQRLADLISKPGKVCFRCLSPRGAPDHPRNFHQCKARCPIDGCGKPHHELLHVEGGVSNVRVMVFISPKSNASNMQLPAAYPDSELDTILPTALARITCGNQIKEVRVAFDSLSQKSFISSKIASDMRLPIIRKEMLNVSGFGGSSCSNCMNVVKFILKPLQSNRDEQVLVEAHVQRV